MTTVVGLAALKKPLQLAKPLNAAPPPQQPLILLPCSKHQEIFDRNTNTKACKCSIDPLPLTFGLVVKVERCKHRERPHLKKCSFEFFAENFFLQLRLLFQFNQTLPQRSQTVHIRKQMNIRKVLLFLSSLPPPVFTCLSFYFCHAST